MRSNLTHIHLLRSIALVVALLVLAAGFSALTSGTVHAQSLSTVPASIAAPTFDGLGMVPGCTAGDSWCAYCMGNPASDICAQFRPATAKGSAAVGGSSNSGNAPVFGVDAGMPGTTNVVMGSMTSIAGGLASPLGVSWQWCNGIWVPLGTAAPNPAC